MNQINRRAGFNTTDHTIDQLLDPGYPDRPVKTWTNEDYPAPGDPDEQIQIGQTWVDYPTQSASVKRARLENLKDWLMIRMLHGTLVEKMIFFFINHFGAGIDQCKEPGIAYSYLKHIEDLMFTNYAQLLKAVTTHPAMLIFLNADGNKKSAPNANYAREILELFSLGKDGEKYTEYDIREASRCFTGMYVVNNGNIASTKTDPSEYDDGVKTFSKHFANIEVRAGALEFVNMLFFVRRQEIAEFMTDKIRRFFLTPLSGVGVDDEIEGSMLNDGNLSIVNAVKNLFSRGPLFDQFRGSQVKSPLDLICSLRRDFNIELPEDPVELYKMAGLLRKECAAMGMDLGNPPGVKGYQPYHQKPELDQLWYDGATAVARSKFLDKMFDEWAIRVEEYFFCIDPIDVMHQFDHVNQDPYKLVAAIVEKIMPLRWSDEEVREVANQTLLSGQAETRYWTSAVQSYLDSSGDLREETIVYARMVALLKHLINHPQYQLQ